jgi:hypothetical protein
VAIDEFLFFFPFGFCCCGWFSYHHDYTDGDGDGDWRSHLFMPTWVCAFTPGIMIDDQGGSVESLPAVA